jgi:hypothetical protein
MKANYEDLYGQSNGYNTGTQGNSLQNPRTALPIEGKIDYDQPGKLGQWFRGVRRLRK